MTDHHHHRGRRRYDEVYDPYHTDYSYESRPRRHRSLGRQALDKLEDVMAGLGIDDRDRDRDHHHHHHDRDHRHHAPSSSSSSGRHRSRHRSPHYRHDHHSHEAGEMASYHHHHRHHRAHSSSPTRHSRHHHHNHNHRSHHEREHPPRTSRASRSRTRASRSRTRASRSRTRAKSQARSRSRVGTGLKAAMEAGALEAVRVRKEPGAWAGAKGGRVATAAISAGVIGAAAEKRKQDHDGNTRMGTKGSALAGMVVNRLVNGPRSNLRD